jgi:hypothetical protein
MKNYFFVCLWFVVFSSYADTGNKFFDSEILDNMIKNPNFINGGIIFDKMRLGQLKEYGGLALLNTNMSQHYIDYMNYNIILLIEDTDNIKYVRDYLVLKKDNPETHLANGPVEINGTFFDWEITVVVDHKWRSLFTEDISMAFKVNQQTKRIEHFVYDTIKLYSED